MRSTAESNKRRLLAVLALTATYVAVEVLAAIVTNSLSLLSDAGHMFADSVGLGLSYMAISYASRPATPGKTYGYYRLEILAAFVNGIILVLISGYILFEGFSRLVDPPEVRTLGMLAVAFVGLALNLASFLILRGPSSLSLNIRGAFLEVLADMLGSVGVLAAGLVIMTTGWYVADPLVSIIIAVAILPRTWKLMSDSADILLEGTPSHLNLAELERALLKTKGVTRLHDLHSWTITSGLYAISSHVVVEDLEEGDRILSELIHIAREHFGIEHTTFQLEREIKPPEGERLL